MPYINEEKRRHLDLHIVRAAAQLESPGDLNYSITRLCDIALDNSAISGLTLRYERLNAIIGVLECAKLEYYRRTLLPYENAKLAENGDVYGTREQDAGTDSG